jgi:hypothetical protein
VAAVALTGCSGSADKPAAASEPGTQPTPSQPSNSGNDDFALGTLVTITSSGFSPKVLVAPMGQIVTWRNESGSTQSVRFDNAGERVDSGPIRPGESWTFDPPGALSLLYHSTYPPRFKAQLQVQLLG